MMKYLKTFEGIHDSINTTKVYTPEEIKEIKDIIMEILSDLEEFKGCSIKIETENDLSWRSRDLWVYEKITYRIRSNNKDIKVEDVKAYIYHLISFFDDKKLIQIIAFDLRNHYKSFWQHNPMTKDKDFEEEIESNNDLELNSVRIEFLILKEIKLR